MFKKSGEVSLSPLEYMLLNPAYCCRCVHIPIPFCAKSLEHWLEKLHSCKWHYFELKKPTAGLVQQ
jgi:hypothetical protein